MAGLLTYIYGQEQENKRHEESIKQKKFDLVDKFFFLKDNLGKFTMKQINDTYNYLDKTGQIEFPVSRVEREFNPMPGFTEKDLESPDMSDIPEGRIRLNPETGQYEIGHDVETPITLSPIKDPNEMRYVDPVTAQKIGIPAGNYPASMIDINARQNRAETMAQAPNVRAGAALSQTKELKTEDREQAKKEKALSTANTLQQAFLKTPVGMVATDDERAAKFNADYEDALTKLSAPTVSKTKSASSVATAQPDSDLQAQATQILRDNGKQVTPETIKMVIERLRKVKKK